MWNNFFWRPGDLKNESQFLKKSNLLGVRTRTKKQQQHLLGIKNTVFSHKNGICTFMRCRHLTYNPWIWLKVTSTASTASNRKSAKNP